MGSLVISLDAELAWGVHDLYPLSDERETQVAVARDAWTKLVDLFEEYRVPATWAVVGHLLIEDGDEFRRRHPLGEEWFGQAIRGLADRPDRWLGIDLVDSIRTSPVDHEIGSHSFSHVVFDKTTAAVADAECRLAREAAAEHGLDTQSFVFPRNAIGHRRALSEAGFTCYRGPRPWRLPALPGVRGGSALVSAATGLRSPPIVTPRVTDYGLVEIPASMFLGKFRGELWSGLATLGADPVVQLATLGIDRVCERSGIVHFWLHPNDLTHDIYVKRIKKILSHAAKRRDERGLRIETMGTVADRINGERVDE